MTRIVSFVVTFSLQRQTVAAYIMLFTKLPVTVPPSTFRFRHVVSLSTSHPLHIYTPRARRPVDSRSPF